VVSTRPLTAEESLEILVVTNADIVQQRLAEGLVTLQTIINTPNNQINPAAAIKDVARTVRRLVKCEQDDYATPD
jgi:hypothetical protein